MFQAAGATATMIPAIGQLLAGVIAMIVGAVALIIQAPFAWVQGIWT